MDQEARVDDPDEVRSASIIALRMRGSSARITTSPKPRRVPPAPGGVARVDRSSAGSGSPDASSSPASPTSVVEIRGGSRASDITVWPDGSAHPRLVRPSNRLPGLEQPKRSRQDPSDLFGGAHLLRAGRRTLVASEAAHDGC